MLNGAARWRFSVEFFEKELRRMRIDRFRHPSMPLFNANAKKHVRIHDLEKQRRVLISCMPISKLTTLLVCFHQYPPKQIYQ
jgi:hypothetical protein